MSGRPAARPIRHVHLGLGNFFRAHQAFYTERASDAADWGIAAFTGRSAALADAMNRHGSRYTLITRGPSEDRRELISSVTHCYSGQDEANWLRLLAAEQTRLVTLTVTEAAYATGAQSSVATRLVTGLTARRAADSPPLAIVACDNLTDNGTATREMVLDCARSRDPGLADWISESVSFVSTVVDRITPRSAAIGGPENAMLEVVTEPFSEWILSGAFPGGRPAWTDAGARFVDDLEPYEHRKLWLLNGGHCLLAYVGALRGHLTVAAALADPRCAGWLADWWREAQAHVSLPAADLADYQQALLGRFSNARIEYQLAQIAADGSQKLPIRVLPVVRAERAADRMPLAGLRILAAWMVHLRGGGLPLVDPEAKALTALAAGPLIEAVPRVLSFLDESLAADFGLVDATRDLARQLAGPESS